MEALNSEEVAKAAKCAEKEAVTVSAQCKKTKEMTKSVVAMVAAVAHEMEEAVAAQCKKTKEMPKLVAVVVAAVAQLKEMKEAALAKAALEAAAAAFEVAADIRNRVQSALRYPTGVFEKLDRWFPANDISKLYPLNDLKKRTVEALNRVITLLQVTTFCAKRRLRLSRKNESMV